MALGNILWQQCSNRVQFSNSHNRTEVDTTYDYSSSVQPFQMTQLTHINVKKCVNVCRDKILNNTAEICVQNVNFTLTCDNFTSRIIQIRNINFYTWRTAQTRFNSIQPFYMTEPTHVPRRPFYLDFLVAGGLVVFQAARWWQLPLTGGEDSADEIQLNIAFLYDRAYPHPQTPFLLGFPSSRRVGCLPGCQVVVATSDRG